MVTTLSSNFSIGQTVLIDDDLSLKARVIGYLWRGETHYPMIELTWMQQGTQQSGYFHEWRLTPHE